MSSILSIENLVVIKKPLKTGSSIKEVPLLKGISTFFESGKLNAIMGPNGASKTTLIQFLYGNCESTTKSSGSILYNGAPRNIEEWRNIASIVEQHDQKTNFKTPREYIEFYLCLKNQARGTKEKINDHDEVLEKLCMTKLLDSSIVSLSGGENHRLMIATEIIMQKKILILDEPTSDLDSHLALELIRYLKRLAVENDIMIIFSIHQPADMIVKMFDNFIFMNEGTVIYSGAFNDLPAFLASHNIVKPNEWTITDFLFEAFYNNSSYKEISDMKPAINILLDEIKKNTIESLCTANPTKNAEKVPKWQINTGEIFVLFKRFFNQALLSKTYFFTIIFYFLFLAWNIKFQLSLPGFADYYNRKKEFVSFMPTPILYEFVDKFPNFFNFVRIIALENSGVLELISFSLFTLIILKSSVLEVLPFVENDIRRNCFSPLSFTIAAFLTELFSFCFTGILSFLIVTITFYNYDISKFVFLKIISCHIVISTTIYAINSLILLLGLKITSREFIKMILLILITFIISTTNSILSTLESHFPPLQYVAQGFIAVYLLLFPSFFLAAYLSKIVANQRVSNLKNEFDLVRNNLTKIEKNALSSIIKYFENVILVFSNISDRIYTNRLPPIVIFIFSGCTLPIVAAILFSKSFTPRTCLNP
ncbi:hypothetical protein GINT2_000240 [Glugoides intestinalis]